jgi:hypothetical protein
MKNITYLYIAFLILNSCENMQTVIDLELPPHESKLVINSSNLIGSPFKVFVSHSIDPLSNQKFEFYSDAQVVLYQNLQAIDTLVFVDSLGCYRSHQIPQQGTAYALSVSHHKHKTVKSKSILAPNVIEITTVTHTKPDVNETNISNIEFCISDPIEANFYLLKLSAYYSFINENGQKMVENQSLYYNTSDPSITNGIQEFDETYSNSVLFDDQLFNGQKKSFELSYENYYQNDDTDSLKMDSIKISLHSLDYDYFNYHQSRILQNNTEGGAIFGSEPVNVYNSYTNEDGTEDAYGLFSIVSKDTFMIVK